MMQQQPRTAVKAFLAVVLLLVSSHSLAQAVAVVTHLDGVLVVTHSNKSQKLLGINSEVFAGDTLTTAERTFARLKFKDESEIVLRPKTTFRIDEYIYDAEEPDSGRSILRLFKGGLRAVTGLIAKNKKENFKVETPVAVVGIRGTNFGLIYCQDDCLELKTVSGDLPKNGLYSDVAEGAIILTNTSGELLVNIGEYGFVADSTSVPIQIPPVDGIRVTMPISLSRNSMDGHGLGEANDQQCMMPAQ